MSDRKEFENCACFNVRKVARQLAQFYDRALEPAGLKNTQFTVLAKAFDAGPISITELSRSLDLDRTTLTRNLGVLRREELVVIGPGEDARSKTVSVTAAGQARLRRATPLWRGAQARVLKQFGRGHWSSLRGELERMLDVAKAG